MDKVYVLTDGFDCFCGVYRNKSDAIISAISKLEAFCMDDGDYIKVDYPNKGDGVVARVTVYFGDIETAEGYVIRLEFLVK